MKKVWHLFLLLIIVLSICVGIVVWKAHRLMDSKITLEDQAIFTLKLGTSRLALSRQLCNAKIINNLQLFQLLLYMEPKLSRFKAGTYRFTPNMNIRELLQLLRSGKEVQFSLRFIEGMRLSDYLKQLREAPYIIHTLKDDNYATVAKALSITHPERIEGWFWPDTWLYTANTTDIAMLKRAHDMLISAVEKAWENRDKGLPYKDQNQFVTMASIVEKETAIVHERKKVASVLINRLRIGMRLQTDPTVIYGMGDNYHGRISKKDLKVQTAYNTYVISGLPIGPIATPSKSSLDAAAHPAKTPYLYFVVNKDGRHTFNTNLINHNQSVQNYLRGIGNAQ